MLSKVRIAEKDKIQTKYFQKKVGQEIVEPVVVDTVQPELTKPESELIIETDPIEENIGNIDTIIGEISKRIKRDRELLEMWMNVKEKKDTSVFLDDPKDWTEKDWEHYVSNQRKITDQIILQIRKTKG